MQHIKPKAAPALYREACHDSVKNLIRHTMKYSSRLLLKQPRRLYQTVAV